MKKNMPKSFAIAASFLLSTALFSCSKSSVFGEANNSEPLTESIIDDAPPAGGSVTGPTATLASSSWATLPNGPYTLSQATLDYKNPVTGWAPTRMNMSGGKLKTTLAKNVVGPSGGLVSWIDIADASEYQLSYDFKFDNNFDFSWGGKLGWGFLIGDGFTGGTPGTNGNGGSVRLMWYKNYTNGPVFIKPYIYYKDQPGQYGNDFGKAYPTTGSIAKNVWHNVNIYIKCNTGSNTDGRLKMTINGSILLDMPIRYTTNDAKRLINRITFETFRGGADASWTTPTDGDIYFDNVSWTAMN